MAESTAKRRKLSGFKLPDGVKKWSNPAALIALTSYLEANGMRLELDKSPPQSTWNAPTKLALTCKQCNVTNLTTQINNLQQGSKTSCLCGYGKNMIDKYWYYEAVIVNTFTDRNGKLWYAKLHDGTIKKPNWETWLAAASQGNHAKIKLSCTHCGVRNESTSITSLQNGAGMSCMCFGIVKLTTPWYYDNAISKPFIDRDGKVWYAKLHDGTIDKPSWETWLAAADQGAFAKLKLTCAHCGITNHTTIIASLQQGQGMSCMCSQGKNVLNTKWYYENAIVKPFTDRKGVMWYKRLHDGSIEPVSLTIWSAAAAQGASAKISLTCTHCGVENKTTTISHLRDGTGMSCMCGGIATRATPWYYEAAISKPFTDWNGKLWYARFHDGSIHKPTLETWLAAAEQGNEVNITLTCAHCGVENETTTIASLQQGHGMSCLCGGRETLATQWYYENAICIPFTDRNGKKWYSRLHDGSIHKPTLDAWLAAADQGAFAKLKLTCAHCGVENEISIASLQQGRGIACKCTMSSSQRKALTWLQVEYPQYTWQSEIRDCTRDGRALPFDIACRELGFILENDGDQHFEIDGFFVRTPEDLDKRARTDLFKEQWVVANGFAVARIVWSDVLYDMAPWQGFLRNVVEARINGTPVQVYTPEWSPQYTSGVYYTLRNTK